MLRQREWTREDIEAINYFLNNQSQFLDAINKGNGRVMLSDTPLNFDDLLEDERPLALWYKPFGPYLILCGMLPSSGCIKHWIIRKPFRPVFRAEHWLNYEYPKAANNKPVSYAIGFFPKREPNQSVNNQPTNNNNQSINKINKNTESSMGGENDNDMQT